MKNLKSYIAIVFLIISFINTAKAELPSFQEALKLAKQGDAAAQAVVSVMYSKGISVKQNHKQSLHWLEASANQNYTDAQWLLGMAYLEGKNGLSKDFDKAYEWFNKAAILGHSRAQNSLAVMYSRGLSVGRNFCKAMDWFKKSANQNDALAQVNVGSYYAEGKCVDKSNEKAKGWYAKAANQGDLIAQSRLAKIYYLDKTFDKALFWFQKSASQNDSYSQFMIANMYFIGQGVEKNNATAAKWFEKSCSNNFQDACRVRKILKEGGF